MTHIDLLRAIAQAPGSRLRFYQAEKKLLKFFKKSTKAASARVRSRVLQTTSILTKVGHAAEEREKVRALYITPREFLLRLPATLDVGCPGCRGD